MAAILGSLNKILLARTPATSVVQSLVMKVLVIVLSLGCGMITARALGPAGRGAQSAIVLWPYFISGLAGLGLAPALTYHTTRSKHAEGSFLTAAALLTLTTGLAASAIGVFLLPLYLRRFSPDVIHAAQITLFFAPAILVGNIFRANLEARGNFSAANYSRVWPVLFTLVALAALWLMHRLTPFAAALALFTPLAAQTVWLGCDLLARFSLNPGSVISSARTLLSYGLRTYGTDVCYSLSGQVDQAFIIMLLSPASLGYYAVALTASRQLTLIQNSLNMVLLPRASALEFDSALELVGRMARISNLVTSVAAVLALLILPVIIPLLYGKSFIAASLITQILVIESLLMGAASVFAQAFNATGRPGVVSLFQAGWILTSIGFLVVLVPRMGLSGAAVSLLLSSLVRLIVTLICYPVVLHRSIPRLIPTFADYRFMMSKLVSYRSKAYLR